MGISKKEIGEIILGAIAFITGIITIFSLNIEPIFNIKIIYSILLAESIAFALYLILSKNKKEIK